MALGSLGVAGGVLLNCVEAHFMSVRIVQIWEYPAATRAVNAAMTFPACRAWPQARASRRASGLRWRNSRSQALPLPDQDRVGRRVRVLPLGGPFQCPSGCRSRRTQRPVRSREPSGTTPQFARGRESAAEVMNSGKPYHVGAHDRTSSKQGAAAGYGPLECSPAAYAKRASDQPRSGGAHCFAGARRSVSGPRTGMNAGSLCATLVKSSTDPARSDSASASAGGADLSPLDELAPPT